jgi:hypothetical protein
MIALQDRPIGAGEEVTAGMIRDVRHLAVEREIVAIVARN